MAGQHDVVDGPVAGHEGEKLLLPRLHGLGLLLIEVVVAQQVQQAFSQKGFSLEKRPFAAHLTLGRQVLLPEGFDLKAFSKTLPASTMQVERVSLMKSERINGRLTYTEMDFVGLNKNREQK